jgi:chondroitin 4-sulfotransferase 11
MPISHALQVIFIHIPKTAGTSIEAALGMHGDKQDIGIRPYFNQTPDAAHLYGGNLQHLTATKLRTVLRDDECFSRYYKFAVVRNPWERLVSTGAWSDQKWARGVELERTEFEQLVRQLHQAFRTAKATSRPMILPPQLEPQVSYVFDERGEPLLDFVARYENLTADWQQIRTRLGVTTELPMRMRSHHRPYQDYYDEASRSMVAEIYADDAAAFGYAF